MPAPRWSLRQTWRDLLFAHWRVDAERLTAVLPPGVEPELIDGSAWIAVTPFELTGLRLRGTPPPPWLSRFPETNVRTYVTFDGRPGVWFLSLDAGSRLAVAAARRAYRLPYFHAAMRIERRGAERVYASRREAREGPPAELRVRCEAAGDRFHARAGTLEHTLIERYRLYTRDVRGTLLRAEIDHPPWSLRPAAVAVERNTMAEPFGIVLPRAPALAHLSERQDTVIWPLAAADSR